MISLCGEKRKFMKIQPNIVALMNGEESFLMMCSMMDGERGKEGGREGGGGKERERERERESCNFTCSYMYFLP